MKTGDIIISFFITGFSFNVMPLTYAITAKMNYDSEQFVDIIKNIVHLLKGGKFIIE